MKISAKIDYACRALLELSLHWPNNVPMQINTIAKNKQIPTKFLTQILLNLKHIGYVQSVRGKRGGYLLSKAPQKIRLNELVESFGGIGFSAAENKSNGHNDRTMDLIWNELDETVLKTMGEFNFETICDRKRSRDRAFTFQI